MDPIPTLPEITHRIFMDITIEDQNNDNESDTENSSNNSNGPRRRIIIGLFGHNAPTAAENFRLLATCAHTHWSTDHRKNKKQNWLCYKDTIFHRIIPYFAIQGGDTTHANGMGGMAAISGHNQNNNNNNNDYQPYMINATNFNRPYMVAVATPNTKRAKSQFFITTVKAQWLQPLQYTIFGIVLEGRDVLHEMEQTAGTLGGRPQRTVRIVDCGEMPLQPYDAEPHYWFHGHVHTTITNDKIPTHTQIDHAIYIILLPQIFWMRMPI